jgi:hypothetical protein
MRTSILDVRMTSLKWCKVHKYMRTHWSEGETKPGWDGPGPIGPSQPARPTPGVGSALLFMHPKILQP